jgi:1-acyl-sn-glycerol-3-phosphate acyltransferase
MLSRILYRIGQLLIHGYAHFLLKMDVRWKAVLPEGPVLFAANHPSTTDPVFLHLLTRKPMSMMIISKVFSIPFLGRYMRGMRHIPVVAGKGEQALAEAGRRLGSGHSVAIFPEGLISPPGGKFNPPRSGVARLALSSGVPVVPIGISLLDKACKRFPTNLEGEPDIITWYLKGPYAITIGKPMRFTGPSEDRELVRKVAFTIMKKIERLSAESARRIKAQAAINP